MNRTLVVTNDFPPRQGGIQGYVHSLVCRLPPESVVVYAPAWPGAAEFDAAQPFPVIRHPSSLMLPVASVSRRAKQIVAAEGCDTVWFGAAAPLGLLAPTLRRAGVQRVVASTHGHEAGWAMLPGARALLRRISRDVDVITYLGEYTKTRMAKVLDATAQLAPLPPGVDVDIFHPNVEGGKVRARLGLGERPTVVCVSRLVQRKGQDMLIRAMPLIQQQVRDAVLVIVGGGPDSPRLNRLAAQCDVADDVIFTGAVEADELPEYFAAGHVFAMPCRTRHGGLDVEGLGMVYLEASATGLPVVAGNSGGAPDAVLEGETGYVVDGTSVVDIADRISRLLLDPQAAQAMGARGREWVEAQWRWEILAERLVHLLHGDHQRGDQVPSN